MTYDKTYLRLALLRDMSALKLPAKATTERLLLTAHYQRIVDEFERVRLSIFADKTATDEEKVEALRAKADEEATADDRRFSVETFGRIVEVALAAETVKSVIDGKERRAEEWLQTVALELVEY